MGSKREPERSVRNVDNFRYVRECLSESSPRVYDCSCQLDAFDDFVDVRRSRLLQRHEFHTSVRSAQQRSLRFQRDPRDVHSSSQRSASNAKNQGFTRGQVMVDIFGADCEFVVESYPTSQNLELRLNTLIKTLAVGKLFARPLVLFE